MKKMVIVSSYVFLLLSGCSAIPKEQPIEKPKENNVTQEPIVELENEKDETEKEDPDFLLESTYFNQVQHVDGKAVIQNPENVLVLVNKEYSLPRDYIPEDLTRPNIPFSFGDLDILKSYMREEAARAVEEMFQQAKSEGIVLYGVSAYRPYEYQQTLFSLEVKKKGEEKAVQAVAKPGQSEHQTGLTIDVTSESVNFRITEEFGETKEGKWLAEHAHQFGFIIRYPKGKEVITQYQYEPWHIRYVGKKVARILYEHNLTLEEYFEQVKKI